MSKTTNKFSPEVRDTHVGLVLWMGDQAKRTLGVARPCPGPMKSCEWEQKTTKNEKYGFYQIIAFANFRQ